MLKLDLKLLNVIEIVEYLAVMVGTIFVIIFSYKIKKAKENLEDFLNSKEHYILASLFVNIMIIRTTLTVISYSLYKNISGNLLTARVVTLLFLLYVLDGKTWNIISFITNLFKKGGGNKNE